MLRAFKNSEGEIVRLLEGGKPPRRAVPKRKEEKKKKSEVIIRGNASMA